jgi:hypothetical protein
VPTARTAGRRSARAPSGPAAAPRSAPRPRAGCP